MADHGRFIFIYNNIRTNQVIYSLSRALKEKRALRQLTFVGKKSVPSEIRRDLWKPLATVIFPSGHQGLSAYRKLREFRKMHEFCWKPEPGQTPPPKKERIKLLMDQKANSIADLAAVLKIQEQDGARLEELHRKEIERAEERIATERKRKIALAELAASGKLQQLEQQAKKLEARHQRAVEGERKKALENQIRAYRRKMIEMRTAQKEIAAQKRPSAAPAEGASPPETNDRDFTMTQSKVDESAGLNSIANVSRDTNAGSSRRHGSRFVSPRASRPVVTVNGIVIRWADLTDAEYAESWPSGVFHDILESAPMPEAFQQELDSVVQEDTGAHTQYDPTIGTTGKGNAGFMGRLRSFFSRQNPRILDRAST